MLKTKKKTKKKAKVKTGVRLNLCCGGDECGAGLKSCWQANFSSRSFEGIWELRR